MKVNSPNNIKTLDLINALKPFNKNGKMTALFCEKSRDMEDVNRLTLKFVEIEKKNLNKYELDLLRTSNNPKYPPTIVERRDDGEYERNKKIIEFQNKIFNQI